VAMSAPESKPRRLRLREGIANIFSLSSRSIHGTSGAGRRFSRIASHEWGESEKRNDRGFPVPRRERLG
jgi:hypothetical protein